MPKKQRKIEIFSAGCNVCTSAIEQIRNEACESCDIQVLEMDKPDVKRRAHELGIKSLPAVVIDGERVEAGARHVR